MSQSWTKKLKKKIQVFSLLLGVTLPLPLPIKSEKNTCSLRHSKMHVKSCFFKNLYAIINAPYPYPFSEPSSNFGPIGFDQLIIVCWGIQSSEYIFCSIQHYTKILVPKAQLTTVG